MVSRLSTRKSLRFRGSPCRSTAIPLLSLLSVLLLVTAGPCLAQATSTSADPNLLETNNVDSAPGLPSAFMRQPLAGDPGAPALPQTDTTGGGEGWHFAVSPYLWFPGMHGTATGPNGRGLSFRASAGDLLSNVHFGLMGTVEASHGRFVTTGDLLWIRLEDDKSIPVPVLGASAANMEATEFFLTPKVGVRVINRERLKVTALTGIRYWHLGESLNFSPSLLGINFSGSQNFVDPLVGGRIDAGLTERLVVTILGDVGGWGTGSQLEYQWAGVLGYRMNASWALQAGYRYLNIDKQGNRGINFNATTAGVVFGITLTPK